VLVRVHAAAVNPVDWKMVEGYMSLVVSRFPFVPGFDISGIIVEIGPGVTRFKEGDEVFAMADFGKCGAFADYVAIHTKFLAHKPKGLTHVEAASIPLAGLTTYQALLDHAHLKEGQKLLIVGGSSGTGSFGVQLAKHMGAYVVAVCSGKNVEFVQSLGADQVIDYMKDDWGEMLKDQNFDVVYDCVGGFDLWRKSHQVLKKGGHFATIAGDTQTKISIGKVFEVAGAIINRKFWSIVSDGPQYDFILAKALGTQLEDIKELIEKGAIRASICKVYPLEEIVAVFEESMTQRARGKIVVAVVDDGQAEHSHGEEGNEHEHAKGDDDDEPEGKEKYIDEGDGKEEAKQDL